MFMNMFDSDHVDCEILNMMLTPVLEKRFLLNICQNCRKQNYE